MADDTKELKPKEKPRRLTPYTPEQVRDIKDYYRTHDERMKQLYQIRSEYMNLKK